MSYKQTKQETLNYFAAANGYDGFRSYFETVFKPTEYTDIYILKGGPGTGKSSFMKKIISDIGPKVDKCEAIYCSSDPNSLDGVILSQKEKKIAILDGTAPHATDPTHPGAIDRIINLGESWDKKLLKNNRSNIEIINDHKSKYYKTAYEYLSIAGKITKSIDNLIKGIYINDDSTRVKEIINGVPCGEGNVEVRLVTSYGKNGFGRLDTISKLCKKKFCVVGIYGSEYKFMYKLKKALDDLHADYILCPSVLDNNKIYALYIKEAECAVIADNYGTINEDNIVDTSRFLNSKMLTEVKDKLEFLWKEREVMLWNSADEFRKASDEHFKLEKIYTAAMDFDKINKTYVLCKQEIENTLELT